MSRRLARLGLLLAATTACGVLMLSTAAWGAVRLGPDTSATPDGNTGCGADACTFVNRSGPADVIVAAPFDGVLARWAIVTSTSTQTWRLRTVREVLPEMFIATGSGSAESVAPGAERSFATQLSIRAGDLIAVDGPASAAAPLAFRGGGGTNSRFNPPLLEGDPARSPNGGGGGFMGMVSALLEPDCDKDGLGDETQDTNLSTCAPGTTPPPAPGTATATCRGIPATIVGTPGNDVRTGSQGRDVMLGLEGDDTLRGLAGNDVICGAKGNDKLNGGKGKDTLLGQKGNDKLKGRSGKDKLSGKKGKDTLKGGGGNDKLKGGGGRDVCIGGKANDSASKCEVEKSI